MKVPLLGFSMFKTCSVWTKPCFNYRIKFLYDRDLLSEQALKCNVFVISLLMCTCVSLEGGQGVENNLGKSRHHRSTSETPAGGPMVGRFEYLYGPLSPL